MAKAEAYRAFVTERADSRCEYCHYPQEISNGVLDLEHIVPESLGGEFEPDNLALSCRHCNLHKLAKVDGIDPQTGATSRLFHPRKDGWKEHFRLDRQTGEIVGLTAVGRVTVAELKMNAPLVVSTRLRLLAFGML